MNEKTTDEGAAKHKERMRGGKNITGGQLSVLFLEDCFSILQQGRREQGGSVWQLAAGGARRRNWRGAVREWRRSERVHGPRGRPVQ